MGRDAYILSNLAGDKLYSFVPHSGLTAITPDEAGVMITNSKRHAERIAAEGLAKAARVSEVDAVFA